jgi:hypothetical protein
MKNLNVFIVNTHDFLDDVLNSKRNTQDDPTYKERLTLLTPNVKLCFNSYDIAHNANNHISLMPHGYIAPNKDDLLKLYNSKAKKLVTFKNTATTVLDNRVSPVCQYCTINSANTLDHIIPKSAFSEFAVNPKNLLPACSECNGYKLDRFHNNNDRLFLNLYTDVLPLTQYLFTDIQILNGVIQADFRLSNINNINPQLFSIIESHYDKLYLFRRFKSKSDNIISEMTNSITSAVGEISKEAFLKITFAKINKEKVIHGANHYKLILEETLLNTNAYLDLYFT